MGYPMALNLRKGLDASTTLLINDVVESAISKFQKDAEGLGPVEVIKSGYEAAQKAVSTAPVTPLLIKSADDKARIWSLPCFPTPML